MHSRVCPLEDTKGIACLLCKAALRHLWWHWSWMPLKGFSSETFYRLWLSHPAASERPVLSQARGLAAHSDLQVKQLRDETEVPACKGPDYQCTKRLLKVVNTSKVSRVEGTNIRDGTPYMWYSKMPPFEIPPDRSAAFYRRCERSSCEVDGVCFWGSSVSMSSPHPVHLVGPEALEHPTVAADLCVFLAWTCFWPSLPSAFALYLPAPALFP